MIRSVYGYRSSYITMAGEYSFYLGQAVDSAEKVFSYFQETDALYERLSENLAPSEKFEVITPVKA